VRKILHSVAFLLCVLMTVAMFSGCGKQSSAEKFANEFIDSLSALYDKGAEYSKDGVAQVTDYLYGTAAAGTSAMRYAVDCLLYMKGEGSTLADVVGDRLGDWDKIAALGYASPYPYIFEGITDEADGKTDAAKDCYTKAVANPNLPNNSELLKTLPTLDTAALKKLKTRLTTLEDKIFAAYTPVQQSIPRSEYNFSAAYLRSEGRKVLQTDKTAYNDALDYYFAAVRIAPFDGDTYAGIVTLYAGLKDSGQMANWLEIGLLVAPENKTLNTYKATLQEVLNK